MNRISKLITLGALFGLVASFQAGATGPQAPQEEQATKVSDQKLENFSKAYKKVEDIHKKYSASMQAADNKGQAQKLQAETQGKMQKAIKNSGLSIDEYNSILNRIQTDQSLQQRFFDLIEG